MILSEWVKLWLDTYKRPLIKWSTYKAYKDCLIYVTCREELAALRSDDIQIMISDMVADGLSLSSIKHMLTLVRQALRKARSLGYIDNLSMLEELELPPAGRRRVVSFRSDEVQRIISKSYLSYYGDFFLALLFTGCRVGELIALSWSDVNLFTNELYITKTDYRGHIQRVKTDSGDRVIPIYPMLRKLIMRRLDSRGGRGERVFLNSIGLPIKYRSALDAWRRFTDSLGLSPCGLHKLRHTFAKRAIRAGVPVKVVSAWLGHADVTVTLRVYDDVDGEDLQRAAELLQKKNTAEAVLF